MQETNENVFVGQVGWCNVVKSELKTLREGRKKNKP